jgi:hypothetical protein
MADPQLDVERLPLVRDRSEVLDLLPGDERDRLGAGARVEHGRRRADRVLRRVVGHPERLDASLLEEAQHPGVVHVAVCIEVAPPQRGRHVQAHVSPS